ncbi:helix-turn-helix domain-containing protein [Sorangium sp. So ce394]|uniref:helix-turn-helix domain-containing protein n=1 Tax=Sorangium sp. So ce394 TaxID=3133310 RepID=UPI003F5B17D8
MSTKRQPSFGLPADAGAIVVGSFEMSSGRRFDWHEHPVHQLVWCARGVLAVSVGAAVWVLPPPRALWIPAGVVHAVEASRPATMRSVYIRRRGCRIRWTAPRVVAASPLVCELIGFLADPSAAARSRGHAERLLLDLLRPLEANPIELTLPRDPRSRRVADVLLSDPADPRTLAAFARTAGACARTLARLFLAETGSTFGQWRTHLRLRAALAHLAAGVPVAVVAERVGYRSASAFIASFRRLLGVAPGAYFATAAHGGHVAGDSAG